MARDLPEVERDYSGAIVNLVWDGNAVKFRPNGNVTFSAGIADGSETSGAASRDMQATGSPC